MLRLCLRLLVLARVIEGFTPLSQPPSSKALDSSTARNANTMPTAKTTSLTSTSSDTTPTQEWDVDRYQTQHDFVWKYGQSLVEIAASAAPKKDIMRVLDLGCGTGELTSQLYDRYLPNEEEGNKSLVVVGIDADSGMIEKAQKQFPHLTFIQGDMRGFKVVLDKEQTLQFDLVFSNAAFHWIPPADVERAVNAIANSLVPDGRLIMEFGGKGNVQDITNAIDRVLNEEEGRDVSRNPWYFPSISDLTTKLERDGNFEVLDVTLYDRPVLLEGGKSGLRQWVEMFARQHFFRNVGVEQTRIQQLLDKIEEELRPILYNPVTDQWTADYRRIRVIARKIGGGEAVVNI